MSQRHFDYIAVCEGWVLFENPGDAYDCVGMPETEFLSTPDKRHVNVLIYGRFIGSDVAVRPDRPRDTALIFGRTWETAIGRLRAAGIDGGTVGP